MYILGISHDLVISSACLIKNGKVVFASTEERLNRIKHFKGFPIKAVKECLNYAKIDINEITEIAVGWNPILNMAFPNQNYSNNARNRWEYLYAIPNQILQFTNNEDQIPITQKFLNRGPQVGFYDHQLSHAAVAFYQSGFKSSAILTVDGRGERNTGLLAFGSNNKIDKIKELEFPNSLGLFYASVTQFLGFRAESDEWKIMALGAYSTKKKSNPYIEKFNKLYQLKKNTNEFILNMEYFSFANPDLNKGKFYTKSFINLMGMPRQDNEKLNAKDYNIAYALQFHFEKIMVFLLNSLFKITKSKNLVLAGGCIMNCKFNGKIIDKTNFENVYIPSAPDDSGISIGSAYLAYFKNKKYKSSISKKITSNYWGREFSNSSIFEILTSYKLKYFKSKNLSEEVSELLSENYLVGWFQGRSEFGQRALGNRSILADPRKSSIKDIVNKSIKYRESFRPFAPAILDFHLIEYFKTNKNEKDFYFMEKTKEFRSSVIDKVSGVVHNDGTGRVQTVSKTSNPKFYNLLLSFKKKTGIPLLLNTSFNLNGEPIVDSPEDAIRTFYSCGLDYLVLGDYIITK